MHRTIGFFGGVFEDSEEKTKGFLYFLKEGVRDFVRQCLVSQRFEEIQDPVHFPIKLYCSRRP